MSQFTITKSDGTKQPFEEKKLISSLKRVGAPDVAISDVVSQVEHGMKDGMTTRDIYGQAFELLHKHSGPAAVKYSIRRAMLELGPDGFPFERFVARIFKVMGYETLTDQTLLGECISHEVDVVAWKTESLVLVEAKYHNEFDLKSDAKVALYIQARREDLSGTMFDYGSKRRHFDEFWLVTNTKFSDMAIRYGECKGLKLVGWNYPSHGNLHDIIEQNGLHPVTALTSLTAQQKRDLVGRGVLVCIDIIGNPSVLENIGLHGNARERVLDETQMVIERAK
ncbi:MAG: restriction endonuclease [Patescibacteria group bacterium]|nr:restriction endonuclease [Patescibacteria group bacterium]